MTKPTLDMHNQKTLSSRIENVVSQLKAGRIVTLIDPRRPKLGSVVVCAAEMITPEVVNFMASKGAGVIYAALTDERCHELCLPPMTSENQSQRGIDFTVSVEARLGVTTGISAADRACTIRTLVDPRTKPADLTRPGHIFPLRARPGGVLERPNFTEAAVDLMLLTGGAPGAALCSLINKRGEVMSEHEVEEMLHSVDMSILNIQDLIRYRLTHEPLVENMSEHPLESPYGPLRLSTYRNTINDDQILAFVFGEPEHAVAPLVHVHCQSVIGGILGKLCSDGDFDFGDLDAALRIMAREGVGVFLHMGAKPESNLSSNETLLLAESETADKIIAKIDKSYAMAAQVLRGFGITRVRLLTNHSLRQEVFEDFGIEVSAQIQSDVIDTQNLAQGEPVIE